ncbi:Isoamyl acetate-hydrolyzing esterase [Phaffia rhodozyma]|uniref:Isoamyl acetate-hydrolyzing esterase n=1 Tax=Phaffia rhodozyma TaxID=264483 RepID=A0A0F7SKI8_PHARH|nr:Isoamyl acetate-hydrolyzing esterase [Phaffia rhodozyma]
MSLIQNQAAIVLLGDSLTQYSYTPGGLSARLSDLFIRKHDVINRGFAGYNTSAILPIAKTIIAPSNSTSSSATQPIAFLTLWLGANDAVLESSGNPQHVSIEEYRANLLAILALAPTSVPKFLITPPIPNPPRWAAFRENDTVDRSEENTGRYAQVVREVAAESGEGTILVDAWEAMDAYRKKGGDLDDLLTDGLHLTAEGYEVINSVLFPLIEAQGLTKAEETYPDWRVVLGFTG